MKMSQLYIQHSCPFCRNVLRAADEMGLTEDIHYNVIDAAPGTAGVETVLKIGGKRMVPFLTDGATAMYESGDIISYLKKHGRN